MQPRALNAAAPRRARRCSCSAASVAWRAPSRSRSSIGSSSSAAPAAASSCAGQPRASALLWRGRRGSAGIAVAVVKENPQNVPEVEAVPTPELTALQAVEAQLKARVNHGIHLMYEFCYDAGSMERSRFFGFSKDLYHVDHFMGAIGNYCSELINCRSYSVSPEAQLPDGGVAFAVQVVSQKGEAAAFDFVLQRQEWGLRKGSWQTKSLTRAEGQ